MSTPSLLNIPYVIKAGTLYSQIPETGAGDFVVTRSASNAATRINSLGFIETVSDNIPRLDYPLGGAVNGCPALLVEPAATNLARWVNQMTAQDTPAASGGMTVTTGSTDFLAPDGTSGSITKYVGGAASGTSQYAYYTGGQVTASASGVHTFSLFVKRGATNPLNFCALGIGNYDGGSGTTYSYFNLASGTALTAGASVQDYGNGWYRLTTAPYTLAAGDLNGTLLFFMAEGNGDRSWPASGALNLTAYTWGAQMEAGSVATSYIPTTTTSITRNADVLTDTSYTLPTPSGSIYSEFIASRTASYYVHSVGPVPITTGSNRIAITYTDSNISVYKNGAFVVSQSIGTYPIGGNIINLGHSSGSFQLNDNLLSFAIYDSTLSAADAISLTSGSI